MSTNRNLDFTFNPRFNPREVRITPPSTLSPYPRQITVITPPSTFPLTSTQIDPATQLRIDGHRHAATGAALTAGEVGKRISALKSLIQKDLDNPSISSSICVQTFKQHVGMGIFRQVCEEVARTLIGNRNADAGEHLLNENFRAILRIRDYDGQSLLDQIVAFYSCQLEAYRGISELNDLGETLEKHRDKLKKASQTTPLPIASQLLIDAAKLRADATRTFQGLPNVAMGALCKRIYELDGGGEKEYNYGYTTALGDVLKLLSNNNACPIKDAISFCSDSLPKVPAFNVSYIQTETIRSNDSRDTLQDIRKIYELENLKNFLNDPYKNNDFVAAKYENLSRDVNQLLNHSICLACQPGEGHLIAHNIRMLSDIKNQHGVDIVSQLIDHFKEKVKAQRLIGEMESFSLSAGGKTPAELLNLFYGLSDKVKEELRGRVWERDGGEKRPEICGWQSFFGQEGYYGTRKIDADPHTIFANPSVLTTYMTELKEKISTAETVLRRDLETINTALPVDPIDVSTARLEREPGLKSHLPPNLKIAYVTAELAGVASLGGLASALDGIVRGSGIKNARVIMPLYLGGHIQNDMMNALRQGHKAKYEIEVDGKKHQVFKAKTATGIRCYFIDNPALFWIPPNKKGGVGNFYEGDYLTVKRRWVVFQSATAELVYKMSKKKDHPVQLVHLHDSQTGLIPKFLASRHPEEWKRGETPATLFTFHNNQDPNTYDQHETIEILQRHGLPRIGANSFMEALRDADVTTTVSETFGKEAQMEASGNGMHSSVKKAAMEGRFFGIVNGNSNAWNPTQDQKLQTWKSVQGATEGQIPDLRFGPDSPDLADKIKTCQRELCAYLKSRPYDDADYADLDPEKPIYTYIGRYDWSQKGIDKFYLMMEEILNNGGQFVCVGLVPDKESKRMLENLKRYARDHGKKGILILKDSKENGKYKYQGVFGNLLRAATSVGIMPSSREPCGLYQGECNRFGKKVVATRTGGFLDTLKTEGPDANAYLFKRCPNWFSTEQDRELLSTLRISLDDANAMQQALYHGDADAQRPYLDSMRTIMRNALHSTWETTHDGSLSPIGRTQLAMAKAFERRKHRGQILQLDLKTLKV
jgi:glycogen synthase